MQCFIFKSLLKRPVHQSQYGFFIYSKFHDKYIYIHIQNIHVYIIYAYIHTHAVGMGFRLGLYLPSPKWHRYYIGISKIKIKQ